MNRASRNFDTYLFPFLYFFNLLKILFSLPSWSPFRAHSINLKFIKYVSYIKYIGEGMVTARVYGIIAILSFIIYMVLIICPYYFWLGREAYIPKSNPDWGYVSPKSLEAWIFYCVGFFPLVYFGFSLSFMQARPMSRVFEGNTERSIGYLILYSCPFYVG